MIEVSCGGKLYLSGEYAVVEGFHAILLPSAYAINIKVDTQAFCSIESKPYFSQTVFSYPDLITSTNNILWQNACLTAYEYLVTHNIKIKNHGIHITSTLENEFHKYGLGSSGALTIGLIDAICQFHDVFCNPFTLYQLGVYAQRGDHPFTSYGDLASSAFRQAILYRKCTNLNYKLPLPEFLHQSWSTLLIQPITISNLPVLIVHSNTSANSTELVALVKSNTPKEVYQDVCKEINQISLAMASAITKQDYSLLARLAQNHHDQLLRLNSFVNGRIWPKSLSDIVNNIPNITFKFSGAGGGDNLIVFAQNNQEFTTLAQDLGSRYLLLNQAFQEVQHVESKR